MSLICQPTSEDIKQHSGHYCSRTHGLCTALSLQWQLFSLFHSGSLMALYHRTTPHSEHRFPASSSKERCRKPVPGVCHRSSLLRYVLVLTLQISQLTRSSSQKLPTVSQKSAGARSFQSQASSVVWDSLPLNIRLFSHLVISEHDETPRRGLFEPVEGVVRTRACHAIFVSVGN